jgi:C-terminal processing protease CtpA/Prc
MEVLHGGVADKSGVKPGDQLTGVEHVPNSFTSDAPVNHATQEVNGASHSDKPPQNSISK